MQTVQFVGVISAAFSSLFWMVGAGVRIQPFSIFTLRGPDSIPAVLQRQSLMNAIAAIFASIAAACHAAELYFR